MTEWVLVPREPTAKMVLAAFDAITNASGEGMIRARWRCMLDAAPAAPQQAEPVAHLWQCLGLWSVDLVTGGTKAELAPPQYLLDAVAAAIRHPVGKVHSPMGPRTPDPTMVICPACTSQFTATPESVQAEVQRLKQERDGLKNRLESRHDGGPDGISARDETIKMQDAEVRRLQEALEPFTAIDLTTNQAVDAMDVLRARRALEGGE